MLLLKFAIGSVTTVGYIVYFEGENFHGSVVREHFAECYTDSINGCGMHA